MTSEQRSKCHTIIHTASVSCGGVGAGLAQVPLSDTTIITPIQIGMIIAIGNVFGKTIPESLAKGFLAKFLGQMLGKGVANVLVGWIPGIGNAINASVAAGLTETIGWAAAKMFDEES